MLPAALVAFATPDPYIVATQTRFYAPLGRKSRYEAYLLTAKGARLRLSRNDVIAGPSWQDRNTVVWLEQNGNRVERWRAKTPLFHRERVATASNRSKKLVSILESEYAKSLKGYDEPRVTAALHSQGNRGWIEKDNQRYPILNWTTSWLASCGGEGKLAVSADDLVIDGEPYEMDGLGSTQSFEYLTIFRTLSAHEGIRCIFKLDPRRKQAHIIPIDAVSMTYSPRRNQIAAYSERRLEAFPDYLLWINDVTLGDLSTGKSRKISLPRSFTIRAEIRP